MDIEAEEGKWGGLTVFPTQILSRDWTCEETNASLRNGIWRDRALDPEGLYRSNASGTWHSKDNILGRLGDAGASLHKMFGEGFTSYATHVYGVDYSKYEVLVRISAWAMVYSDRGYAAVHTHPNCHASGVYYVDSTVPEKEVTMATGVTLRSGDIEFLDTRSGGQFHLEGMRMNPSAIVGYKTGRLLVFPSSLPHYVHPVHGTGERIAIAANATYTLKERNNVSDK